MEEGSDDYGIQVLMIRIVIHNFFVHIDKVGFESACESLTRQDRDHIINEKNYGPTSADYYKLTGFKLTDEQRTYLAMLDL